jgi:hypothetical protein
MMALKSDLCLRWRTIASVKGSGGCPSCDDSVKSEVSRIRASNCNSEHQHITVPLGKSDLEPAWCRSVAHHCPGIVRTQWLNRSVTALSQLCTEQQNVGTTIDLEALAPNIARAWHRK